MSDDKEFLLPYDVEIGSVRFRKGVKLSTFITAAKRWYELAGKSLTPVITNPLIGETIRADRQRFPDTLTPIEKCVRDRIREEFRSAPQQVDHQGGARTCGGVILAPDGLPMPRYDAACRRMTRCQADSDENDCEWIACPQREDGEAHPKRLSMTNGRHCPLDKMSDDEAD